VIEGDSLTDVASIEFLEDLRDRSGTDGDIRETTTDNGTEFYENRCHEYGSAE
jgi:hypothetical protein